MNNEEGVTVKKLPQNILMICRICFKDEDEEAMTSIYDKIFSTNDELNEQISSLLCELTGEVIYLSSITPNLICSTCVCDLTKALAFRRRFLKSEKILRFHLRGIKEVSEAKIELKIYDETTSDYTNVFEIVDSSSVIPDDIQLPIDQPSSQVSEPEIKAEINETDYINIEYLLNEEDVETEYIVKDQFEQGPKQVTSKTTSKNSVKKQKSNPCVQHEKPARMNAVTSTLEIPEDELEFACCMCKYICVTEDQLNEHIKIHKIRDSRAAYNELWGDVVEKRGKQCHLCLKSFVSRRALWSHRKSRYLIKKFQCEHCGESFGLNELLRKHVAKVHPLEAGSRDTEKVECKICGKLITKMNIRCHEKNHTDKDKYTCKICSKKFSSVKYLKQHALTHTDLKTCACNVCGKQFKFKENLTTHLRVHSNDRKYKCEYCEKAYIHFTDWSRHTKGHTGERPHTCAECGKGFIKKYCLTIHMRKMHTNEKPYQCEECPERFVQGFDLKNHVNKYHQQTHIETC